MAHTAILSALSSDEAVLVRQHDSNRTKSELLGLKEILCLQNYFKNHRAILSDGKTDVVVVQVASGDCTYSSPHYLKPPGTLRLRVLRDCVQPP